MNPTDVARKYVEYSRGLSKILYQEDSGVLLKTSFVLPFDDDESVSVVLQDLDQNHVSLHDGGQIASYYWQHGIDLAERRDPWRSILSICEHADISYDDEAFTKHIAKKDSEGAIHSFAMNLMAIAALINEFPAQVRFKPRFVKQARQPKTILRNNIGFLGVEIERHPESLDVIDHYRVYEDVPYLYKGAKHQFPFYVRNGSELAIDTLDQQDHQD